MGETRGGFHTLRVALEEGPGVTPGSPRTHALYQGVSVNSWFSPLGIANRERPSTGYISLPDECRRTLEERARSAGAVLGRRYYEVGRQLLDTGSILQGKKMTTTMSARTARVKDLGKEGSSEEDFTPPQRSRSRVTFEDDKDPTLETYKQEWAEESRRPKTAPSILHAGNSQDDQKESLCLPELAIKGLFPSQIETNPSGAKFTGGPRSVSAAAMRSQPSRLDETSTTYSSVLAMKEAFQRRINAQQLHIDQHVQIDNRQSACEPRDSLSRKTRRARGQSPKREFIIPRNRFETPRPRVLPRSAFRPLVTSNEDSPGDSARYKPCPAGCKGCFKACLASAEYANVSLEAQAPSRKPAVTPKRSTYKTNYHIRYDTKPTLRVVRRRYPTIAWLFIISQVASQQTATVIITWLYAKTTSGVLFILSLNCVSFGFI